MAKVKKAFFCRNCGFEAPKWLGRCPSCGEWNTFTEEVIARESGGGPATVANLPKARPQRIADIHESEHRRIDLGNREVNRVLGGGLVPGSLVLLGGEPGIGKSTLSLQIALADNGLKTLYVSGEESAEQIKMRALRLGIGNEGCLIYAETLLENILAQIEEQRPDLVVIDSIQTIYTDIIESSAGSVSQIRECAASLLKYAKATGTSIFIIGHITKDGTIAGPKILEHIVDVVLAVRRGQQPDIPYSARNQEPFRSYVRNRRFRDARRRVARGGQSVGNPAYALRHPAQRHRRRSFGRRHPPLPDRGAGTGERRGLRHAPAHGDGLTTTNA